MRIPIQHIKDKASERPSGYVEDVLSKGLVHGDYLLIAPEAYNQLIKKYSVTPPRINTTCCNKPMPPVTTQLKNAVGAASRVVKNIITNQPVMASDDIIKQRQEICLNCEFLNKEKNRCSKCGCWYQKKIKLTTEKCPLGKW